MEIFYFKFGDKYTASNEFGDYILPKNVNWFGFCDSFGELQSKINRIYGDDVKITRLYKLTKVYTTDDGHILCILNDDNFEEKISYEIIKSADNIVGVPLSDIPYVPNSTLVKLSLIKVEDIINRGNIANEIALSHGLDASENIIANIYLTRGEFDELCVEDNIARYIRFNFGY